jgi:DNA-binding CsgD family transcriptional regulator
VRAVPPGVAVVVTSRLGELAVGDPLLDWLADVSRLPSVETVALSALPPEESLALVAALAGPAPADSLVDDVLRRGQGSPFFIEQLVAAARAAARVGASDEVPAGIGRLLGNRLRSVSGPASEVAAALAVAGRPLSELELAACVGGADVAPALRELVDARLVAAAEDGRYRLRHALLEDTVRSMLLASQRARLHAAAGTVLAARGTESAAEVAVHFARAGDLPREADWSVAAARQAESMFAWSAAAASWLRVWDLWGLLQQERPEVELTAVVLGCILAAQRADDGPRYRQLLERALADDRVTADDLVTAELTGLYGYWLVITDVAAGVATMQRAVALFRRSGPPSGEQARALLNLARAKTGHAATTGTEAAELAESGRIADAAGDVAVQLEVAADKALALLRSGDVPAGLAELAEASNRAVATGTTVGDPRLPVFLSDAYLWLLRLEECIEVSLAGLDSANANGYRESFDAALLVTNAFEALLLRGDVGTAESLVAAHRRPGFTTNGWPLHLASAELDVLGGRPGPALAAVDEAAALGFSYDELWHWLTEIAISGLLLQGDPAGACARSEAVVARVDGSAGAGRTGRLLALTARAHADLADLDPAADRAGIGQELLQRADRWGAFRPHPARVKAAGYAMTFQAELARLTRSGEDVAWRAARDLWSEYGARAEAGYASARLAAALLAAGHRKDAEVELSAAYVVAVVDAPLRRQVFELARLGRLTPANADTAGGGDAALVGEAGDLAPYGLTSRELDVLRLLGTGATNAEIGRRLYMSPKTASVHVSAILRKLGVTGRVQAATVAERRGLLFDESGGDGDS